MTQSVSELYSDSHPVTTGYENGSIAIDKNIPLPTKKAPARAVKTPRQYKYPVRAMVPGDSFFLQGVTYKRAMSVVQMGRKALSGSKWIARQNNDGTRIWRVA